MAADRGPKRVAARTQTALAPSAGAAADLIALAMAVLVPLSLHVRALAAPFVGADWALLDHARRHPLTAQLLAGDPLGDAYRPLSRAVWFTVVDWLGRGTPFAFHALNLTLFVVSGLLLYALARRLAGRRAALVALALFLPTSGADVPIALAGGSQILLALACSLAGLWLWVRGERWFSALVFLCGALSHEAAAVMPVVALLLGPSDGRSPRARLREAWPLGAMLAVWAALWIAHRAPQPSTEFDPSYFAVGLARLPQAFLGLEWAPGTPFVWLTAWPAAGTLTLAALFAMLRHLASRAASRPPVMLAGLAWAALATLPFASQVPLWSSEHALLAVAGLAFALGVAVQRWPDALLAALVLVVSLGAQHARTLAVVASERTPWTTASHVNAGSLERSAMVVTRLLGSLQRQHATLPPASTLFFAQVPASTGFQQGDGAVVRVAYRDTSLRSHSLADFSNARASRGPVLFFVAEGDTLRDHTGDPLVLPSLVYDLIVSDRPQAALDALDLAAARGADSLGIQAWRPWPLLALGRRDEAVAVVRAAGLDTSLATARELAALRTASTDTLLMIAQLRAAVQRHVFDPRLQGRLAQLLMTQPQERASAVVAAYAVRTLTPRDPGAWRNFAVVQLAEGRNAAARASLEHYFRIGGLAATNDVSAQQVHESLRRDLPAAPTEEPKP